MTKNLLLYIVIIAIVFVIIFVAIKYVVKENNSSIQNQNTIKELASGENGQVSQPVDSIKPEVNQQTEAEKKLLSQVSGIWHDNLVKSDMYTIDLMSDNKFFELKRLSNKFRHDITLGKIDIEDRTVSFTYFDSVYSTSYKLDTNTFHVTIRQLFYAGERSTFLKFYNEGCYSPELVFIKKLN